MQSKIAVKHALLWVMANEKHPRCGCYSGVGMHEICHVFITVGSAFLEKSTLNYTINRWFYHATFLTPYQQDLVDTDIYILYFFVYKGQNKWRK